MKSLFKLRGELTKIQSIILGIVGLLILITAWWLLAEAKSERYPINFTPRELPSSLGADSTVFATIDSLTRLDSIDLANAKDFKKVYPTIPTPMATVMSYPALIKKDKLLPNAWFSIWLNLRGYFWALMISIPIGFVLGLFPLFRGMFKGQVDALRFLPLTALIGTFMAFYGVTGDTMKIAFLAFGIMVYLLPVVVQRINEVKDVYLKTVFTLGATDWQTIKSVYIPSVMSRVMDDIRVLTAISWTYIIIAELLGSTQGLGRLTWLSQKTGQTEKVFAILLIFILIGFVQDRIFAYIDRRLFPYKYSNLRPAGIMETQYGIAAILGGVVIGLLLLLVMPNATWIMSSLMPIMALTGLIFILYGEFKIFTSKKTVA